MELGSSSARDPCGEQASTVGAFCVDGFSLVVSKYVNLCIRGQFFKGFLLVLVAFYMEDVGGDGEGCDGGANCLDDVVVGAEEMEGWSLVIDGLEEVFDNCIIVHWDGKGWI